MSSYQNTSTLDGSSYIIWPQQSELGHKHMLGILTSIITEERMITYISLADSNTIGNLEVLSSL